MAIHKDEQFIWAKIVSWIYLIVFGGFIMFIFIGCESSPSNSYGPTWADIQALERELEELRSDYEKLQSEHWNFQETVNIDYIHFDSLPEGCWELIVESGYFD